MSKYALKSSIYYKIWKMRRLSRENTSSEPVPQENPVISDVTKEYQVGHQLYAENERQLVHHKKFHSE